MCSAACQACLRSSSAGIPLQCNHCCKTFRLSLNACTKEKAGWISSSQLEHSAGAAALQPASNAHGLHLSISSRMLLQLLSLNGSQQEDGFLACHLNHATCMLWQKASFDLSPRKHCPETLRCLYDFFWQLKDYCMLMSTEQVGWSLAYSVTTHPASLGR